MDSINDIQFPPGLVAGLYPNSLVADGKPVNWKWLGNNEKKVMVIVEIPEITHLPDEQLEFLTRILKASKLGLGDVAIINRFHYADMPYTRFLKQFKPRILLLFGLSAGDFGFPFDIPAYQVQTFDQYTLIHAPALDLLPDDENARKLLWAGLQKIFKV